MTSAILNALDAILSCRRSTTPKPVKLKVTVPPGVLPGTNIAFQLPGSPRKYTVPTPAGAAPGSQFVIRVTPHQDSGLEGLRFPFQKKEMIAVAKTLKTSYPQYWTWEVTQKYGQVLQMFKPPAGTPAGVVACPMCTSHNPKASTSCMICASDLPANLPEIMKAGEPQPPPPQRYEGKGQDAPPPGATGRGPASRRPRDVFANLATGGFTVTLDKKDGGLGILLRDRQLANDCVIAFVMALKAGASADLSGKIEANDVITHVNGKTVTNTRVRDISDTVRGRGV